jgi:hypothetical protein
LQVGKLGFKRMPRFLFNTGHTGENNGWMHGDTSDLKAIN